MYRTQSNQVDLGQCLADIIQDEANNGATQHFVWQLASQHNYQNEYFARLVGTLDSVLGYWAATQPQQTLANAVKTVYLCACGLKCASNPNLHRQMTQVDVENMYGWADYAQQLDAELSQFEAQQTRGYAPVSRAPTWADSRYPAPANRYQPPATDAWGRPMTQQQSSADWATTGSVSSYRRPAPAAPAPQVPQKSGFRSRSAPAPTAVEITQPDNSAQPVFVEARKGWRSRGNTGTQFDPTAPQHQPVGREVAEAHEAASGASGSWESSNFEWDDPAVVFGEVPQQSAVTGTNTKTPQFMERFSSNPTVNDMVYDHVVDNVRREFTIEDWRTNPDPDFPWELGYTIATHTRRIAYDVRRKCFVQLIEENTVNYDDHSVMDKSAAVRSNIGNRRTRGDVGRGFNGDVNKITTLPGMLEERGQIIDRRLEAAQTRWDKQEEEALAAVGDGGNYVAPELSPSREQAITTPLENETEEQIVLGSGKLSGDQLLTVDLGQASFLNEKHAAYAMQAKLVVDGFDFSDVPVISARYLEVSPFVISEAGAEEILELLDNLTDDTTLKSFIEFAKYLGELAGKIPADIWNTINDQLTMYVNGVLETELGLDGVSIDSFAEDAADLPQYLKENKAPAVLENLSRRVNEFVRPMVCVVNTNLTDESFEAVMTHLYPNLDTDHGITALNDTESRLVDRTVLVRRECTLSRTALNSVELGIYADDTQFVITEASAPTVYDVLTKVMRATARDDGKTGYFKRVLLTSDGVRFTLHENWMGKGLELILKR